MLVDCHQERLVGIRGTLSKDIMAEEEKEMKMSRSLRTNIHVAVQNINIRR